MKAFFRRLRPSSLLGQLLLIIFAGLLVLQGINLLAFWDIQKKYIQQVAHNQTREVAFQYLAILMRPPQFRAESLNDYNPAVDAEGRRNIVLTILPGLDGWALAPASKYKAYEALMYQQINELLGRSSRLSGQAIHVRLIHPDSAETAPPYVREAVKALSVPQFPLGETVLQLDDGAWLSVIQSLGFDSSLLVWLRRGQLLVSALVMAIILFVMLARVTRPWRRLGQAAEQFGRHPEAVIPLPESGSREMREAARSFNQMREKIKNNLAERNRLLSAMAHDLRTPLTRLQLRLESVEPERLRDLVLTNCADISAILAQGLELAQNPQAVEKPVVLDVGAFLDSLADDAIADGRDLVWRGLQPAGSAVRLRVRPLCLKRCLANLLDNAWRYGGRTEMSATAADGGVVIEIADHGPGVAEEELEKVFEPYYRLESSRNRDFGGSGLGLAIARNMAAVNGAKLSLHNRPEGGLLARVELPPDHGAGGGQF